jgi:hypothetical protein
MTKVMKEDEIVLLGSVGLDITVPGYVTPKDLDICVPLGRLFKFQKWLSDNTEYEEEVRSAVDVGGAGEGEYIDGHSREGNTGI